MNSVIVYIISFFLQKLKVLSFYWGGNLKISLYDGTSYW
jgi:hypothetical protein